MNQAESTASITAADDRKADNDLRPDPIRIEASLRIRLGVESDVIPGTDMKPCFWEKEVDGKWKLIGTADNFVPLLYVGETVNIVVDAKHKCGDMWICTKLSSEIGSYVQVPPYDSDYPHYEVNDPESPRNDERRQRLDARMRWWKLELFERAHIKNTKERWVFDIKCDGAKYQLMSSNQLKSRRLNSGEPSCFDPEMVVRESGYPAHRGHRRHRLEAW